MRPTEDTPKFVVLFDPSGQVVVAVSDDPDGEVEFVSFDKFTARRDPRSEQEAAVAEHRRAMRGGDGRSFGGGSFGGGVGGSEAHGGRRSSSSGGGRLHGNRDAFRGAYASSGGSLGAGYRGNGPPSRRRRPVTSRTTDAASHSATGWGGRGGTASATGQETRSGSGSGSGTGTGTGLWTVAVNMVTIHATRRTSFGTWRMC